MDYEYIIAGLDMDGCAADFEKWINAEYPKIKTTLIPRQMGGTILLDADGVDCNQFGHEITANGLWEDFCNS